MSWSLGRAFPRRINEGRNAIIRNVTDRMSPEDPQIFISYSRRDAEFAIRLAQDVMEELSYAVQNGKGMFPVLLSGLRNAVGTATVEAH